MYTFTPKARMMSIILIVIGVVALGTGFMGSGSHHSDEEVKHHVEDAANGLRLDLHKVYSDQEVAMFNEHHAEEAANGPHGHGHFAGMYANLFEAVSNEMGTHYAENEMLEANSVESVVKATIHYYHAKANRPWSALMIGNFFFLAIALGAVCFYALQYATQSGWSAAVLRVPQAMGQYLWIGGGVMLLIIIMGMMHKHHLYHWMEDGITDPNAPNYDSIIAGKSGYLNGPFFLIRAVIYLVGWIGLAYSFKKFSIKEDKEGGTKWYYKAFKRSAIFLVFFAVTSSMMAWDWIMSIDPHWFSTLFGWFIFSGLWVSCITVICFFTIYLKKKGVLNIVNENHMHDFGRLMLSFSNFWMYLWFAQFMLIWYANIPEEVTYYMIRFEEYKVPFIGALVLNWGVPIIFLMSRNSKRSMGKLMFAGVFMLIGHFVNVCVLILPGTVGAHWDIGFVEIGTFLGFAGIFIFVTLRAISKLPIVQENHPMLEESKHLHVQ